ncbi:hypothetical protein V492_08235 [Pseudogymnoascus sp. VKM F-4246]|nr:hypothetical protein V492_08235 [Pseudogymnoascus sp. VKM F-4246]
MSINSANTKASQDAQYASFTPHQKAAFDRAISQAAAGRPRDAMRTYIDAGGYVKNWNMPIMVHDQTTLADFRDLLFFYGGGESQARAEREAKAKADYEKLLKQYGP